MVGHNNAPTTVKHISSLGFSRIISDITGSRLVSAGGCMIPSMPSAPCRSKESRYGSAPLFSCDVRSSVNLY